MGEAKRRERIRRVLEQRLLAAAVESGGKLGRCTRCGEILPLVRIQRPDNGQVVEQLVQPTAVLVIVPGERVIERPGPPPAPEQQLGELLDHHRVGLVTPPALVLHQVLCRGLGDRPDRLDNDLVAIQLEEAIAATKRRNGVEVVESPPAAGGEG